MVIVPALARARMTLAPTVVFDLDGTLIDTAPDLVATLNIIFARENFAPIPYESARKMVGRGARVMIERGLKAQGRMLPPPELERLFRDFIAYYGLHIADHSRPFTSVEPALAELSGRGCRLAVCTNKLEHLSVALLDALGLSRCFAAICGQDTFSVQKPEPEILRATIKKSGGRLDAAVMVGPGFPRRVRHPGAEAFLEGHVLAFEYFGAVPGRVRYDNLGPAVVRVLRSRDRAESERFIAAQPS